MKGENRSGINRDIGNHAKKQSSHPLTGQNPSSHKSEVLQDFSLQTTLTYQRFSESSRESSPSEAISKLGSQVKKMHVKMNSQI